MWWAVKQLCAPLRYLRISQGDGLFKSKLTYDLIIPLILAATSTGAIWALSASLGMFSETGLVPGILNLLNLMIAFFIAALAAVATFDKPSLDEGMKGDPAVLTLRTSKGATRLHMLTNRQFICYVFGYLSFSSIMLIAALYIGRQIGPSLMVYAEMLSPELMGYGRLFLIFLLFLAIWNIFVTMLIGIYFLCDRLQFLDESDV
jgi:hypothetical protein